MYVHTTATTAEVREPDVLTSLSVTTSAGIDLAAVLGDLGTVDDGGEHVWLSIDELRRRAASRMPETERDDWNRSFDAMVGYANSKGWTSPEGSHLRAHITRTG